MGLHAVGAAPPRQARSRRTAQAMNGLDQLRVELRDLMASRRLLQAFDLADDLVDVVAGACVHVHEVVHGVVARRWRGRNAEVVDRRPQTSPDPAWDRWHESSAMAIG